MLRPKERVRKCLVHAKDTTESQGAHLFRESCAQQERFLVRGDAQTSALCRCDFLPEAHEVVGGLLEEEAFGSQFLEGSIGL